MSLDADRLIDRRRLKRRLTFWRLAALVAVVAFVAAAAGRFVEDLSGGYVARLAVEGIIVDDAARTAVLKSVARDRRAKALIVYIDSPGGSVVGGEALFRDLRSVAEAKPVVAVMGDLATSAGYMAALGADRVVARAGSVTGSIGVIMQSADVTGLLDKLGIKPEIVKSAPLKAQPNPLEPFGPEAREATRAVVRDVFELFVDLVAERRGMARERVLDLADGRVFTGRQAVANGLIDGLGGEAEARQWLTEVHGVDEGLPARAVEIPRDDRWWRWLIESVVGKTVFSERLRLDGLVSVWHPEGR